MKKVKKYIIVGIIDLLALAIFAYARGIFDVLDREHVSHILSDDFFAVGVLNFGLGALLWVSNEGGFDMIRYGMRSFWGFFIKGLNKYADFEDYKAAKHSSSADFAHFLIFGAVFIVVAYVFLKIYQLS